MYYAYVWIAVLFTSVYGFSCKQAISNIPSSAKEITDTGRLMKLDSTLLRIETIASGLNVPWEIAWGPDGWIWYTEVDGVIGKVNPQTQERMELLKLADVHRRQVGLLSMAVYNEPNSGCQILLNYVYQKDSAFITKLIRYGFDGKRLVNPQVLLEYEGGEFGHNGSRISISPDNKIFIATGDIMQARRAQDTSTMNGKILRLNIDGSIPLDNPVKGSPVWAIGFRVPQGLAFSSTGNLYSAEHGDATDDEVNRIVPGRNYGYPLVTGYSDTSKITKRYNRWQFTYPLIAWTPTIAPAGLDYYNSDAIPEWKNSLLLATLKTQSLRVLTLDGPGTAVDLERVYFEKTYGRIRDICISPTGDVYLATSNRDWNPPAGFPVSGDDRIIRLTPDETVGIDSQTTTGLVSKSNKKEKTGSGLKLYTDYCASCHKSDATGVPGTFPSLIGKYQNTSLKSSLIKKILIGSSDNVSGNEKSGARMPSFRFLSDTQLALIVSYIGSHFGNNIGRVDAHDVSPLRVD